MHVDANALYQLQCSNSLLMNIVQMAGHFVAFLDYCTCIFWGKYLFTIIIHSILRSIDIKIIHINVVFSQASTPTVHK